MRQEIDKAICQRTELLKALESVTFSGLEVYKPERLLHFPIFNYCVFGHRYRRLFDHVLPFFITAEKYNVIPGTNEFVFYDPAKYRSRRDCRAMLNNVMACVSGSAVVRACEPASLGLNNINRLRRIVKWNNQMKAAGLEEPVRWYLLAYLVQAYDFNLFLESVSSKLDQASCAVMLFDQDVYEYMFVEFCRLIGLRTVTLQHGMFAGANIGTGGGSVDGFESKNLNADYIFVWGELSKERSMSCGVSENRIVVTGHPGHMSISQVERGAKAGLFGVVLDGDHEINRCLNLELLEISRQICIRFGLRASVRLHPADRDTVVEKLVDETPEFDVCAKDVDVEQFAYMIDFGVAAKSSVYAELLMLNCITYRYVPDPQSDVFEEIKTGQFFDADSLIELLNKMRDEPDAVKNDMRKSANYLCASGDIHKRYSCALREIAQHE